MLLVNKGKFYVFYQVISGHTGWVRSVAVEPANKWFATGSADRTIKVCKNVILETYCY